MCYSAQLVAAFEEYQFYGGTLSIKDFDALYGHRFESKAKIPKMLDRWFVNPQTEDERRIRKSIDDFNTLSVRGWEQELFKQRKRLADAERKLAEKHTKAAAESQRIASNKVEQLLEWIESAKRTTVESRDCRIFPNSYAPVLIWRDGQRQIVPMRYMLRPAGKPPTIDKLATLYNARRDNLERFWKEQFGQTHGVVLASAFFEHVERDGQKVILKFQPQTRQTMLAACLWSRWVGRDGDELYSFAAITDEPPAEVAEAGHDRCIIPIKAENLDAWLQPDGDTGAMQRILDDRERPYYEHRIAA
jgi:putative SOS response-associated peptidase YedK